MGSNQAALPEPDSGNLKAFVCLFWSSDGELSSPAFLSWVLVLPVAKALLERLAKKLRRVGGIHGRIRIHGCGGFPAQAFLEVLELGVYRGEI